MNREDNWARIKSHRGRLTDHDMQGLAVILFMDQEDWLEEKLQRREDEALVIAFLGYLGGRGSLKAVSILLKQMETREEALQAAAAEALKHCPAIFTVEPLAKIMMRQNQNAVKAGEALLSFGEEGINELWHMWFGENTPVSLKAQILSLLAEAKDQRAESLAFLAFLSEEDELVLSALKASEELNAGSLWGNVAGCLKNPAWKLRGRAVRLLGQFGGADAVSVLQEMGEDPDPWVEEERQKALLLLREDKSGTATEGLGG